MPTSLPTATANALTFLKTYGSQVALRATEHRVGLRDAIGRGLVLDAGLELHLTDAGVKAINDLLAGGDPDFDAFAGTSADHTTDVSLADADNARARKPRRAR